MAQSFKQSATRKGLCLCDTKKEPATDEHTRREGSLREELRSREEKPRRTGEVTPEGIRGEEIVCSNGEPVFVDEITGKPVALNVLLKSL